MRMVKTESFIWAKEIVNLMTEIDEFKGAWLALGNIAPDRLFQLKKVATIESSDYLQVATANFKMTRMVSKGKSCSGWK